MLIVQELNVFLLKTSLSLISLDIKKKNFSHKNNILYPNFFFSACVRNNNYLFDYILVKGHKHKIGFGNIVLCHKYIMDNVYVTQNVNKKLIDLNLN